jgi:cytochrome c oxidase assembly protein subunit 15
MSAAVTARPAPAPIEFGGTRKAIHVASWVALLLALLPFALGALTTSFKVGMAVPDGATTFGQTLWLYKFWNDSFGVQLEHTHRLAGMLLGIVILGLSLTIFFTESRAYVRWIGMLALGLVIVQGMLGRWRVDQNDVWGREYATLHGSWAQLVLASLVALVVVTSRWWIAAESSPSVNARSIQRWTAALVGITFLQIVVGAFYRHQSRGFYVHATTGYALFLVTLVAGILIVLDDAARRRLGGVLALAFAGVFAQIILGNASALVYGDTPREFVTKISNLQAFTTAGHQVVGSVFFAATIALAMASRRVLSQGSDVR